MDSKDELFSLDEKSYENILIYISYKVFIGAQSLPVWFEKVEGFIKIYDGIRYLVLFGPELHDAIFTGLDIL